MLTKLVSSSISKIAFKKVEDVEKNLGYRLALKTTTNNWISSHILSDMTPIWRKCGINATGLNYYTIGNIEKGISTRYDYTSPYYQAWFGGYIVSFADKKRMSINDHFMLAETDQESWLKLFGDSDPMCKAVLSSVTQLGGIEISGYKAQIFQGSMLSHTDVGNGGTRFLFPLIMALFARKMNRNNPNLNLSGTNFSYTWGTNTPLQPYQQIELHGYIIIVELSEKTKAVLYANGARFTTNEGKYTDTFSILDEELISSLKQTRIIKV